MITENTALFKILFDSNVLDLKTTDVIFGSNFQDDKHSKIINLLIMRNFVEYIHHLKLLWLYQQRKHIILF